MLLKFTRTGEKIEKKAKTQRCHGHPIHSRPLFLLWLSDILSRQFCKTNCVLIFCDSGKWKYDMKPQHASSTISNVSRLFNFFYHFLSPRLRLHSWNLTKKKSFFGKRIPLYFLWSNLKKIIKALVQIIWNETAGIEIFLQSFLALTSEPSIEEFLIFLLNFLRRRHNGSTARNLACSKESADRWRLKRRHRRSWRGKRRKILQQGKRFCWWMPAGIQ